MEFEGEFVVPLGREAVYGFLSDPQKFGRAIPELEEVSVRDGGGFMARVRTGISYLRGSLEIQFERVADADEAGRAAAYRGKGLGMGSFVEVEAGFSLEEVQAGSTRVRWRGVAKIGGRLASVGGGLLEPVARRNMTQFIGAIQTMLGGLG